MSRRSGGFTGAWAEAQRQQQRRLEAEARQQRDRERQARARQRRAAQAHREQRQAEAGQRTAELEARVASLREVLSTGCRVPAFRAASLLRSEEVRPFSPGPLAVPVPLPDPDEYRARTGWTSIRRTRAQAEARACFERDLQAAQAEEARRQEQVAVRRREYDRWAEARRSEARRHNAGVTRMIEEVRRGGPEAVVEYFTAALHASPARPEGFPRQVAAAYDTAARQLVLDWELPGYGIVPEAKSVRYVPALDQDKETPRPEGQRRALYREVLAQCVLLVLHDLFAADEFDVLESVALNGFVDDHDPVTGRRARIFLATVMTRRSAFTGLRLEQVDAVSCLTDGLRGQLSSRPDRLGPVRPARVPQDVGDHVATHGEDEEPDLYDMDPVAFESLVAELFRAMGMRAVTTQRSHDGGVDVDAVDPAPIRGGKIVVQVKRYRATVPPTAVRDLYGTMQDAGANKGVLVTTAGFGPGSHAFAHGKPLELVSGGELIDLLHRHGLRGRLGEGGRAAPKPQPSPPGPSTPPEDHNVLGVSWSGDVALDACVLICSGGRVLGDDHFVFYNNVRSPDGSVRLLPAVMPDKAAIRVSFDSLPDAADRVVLAVAVDPEADPDADLTGFTDACIRLLDPSMTELAGLAVSDGRPRETALVLGSFRRRDNGDWDFVPGGKGYTGGLERLVQDYGITVVT
ncbi:restriction endonuclease [Streptomyces sp. NPDC003444]